jgi:two-component system, LuxR family, sensor histidine kinase DctS
MPAQDSFQAPVAAAPRRIGARGRRVLLWAVLITLLLVAQGLLVALSLNYERGRAQDEAEAVATRAAAELRRDLLAQVRSLNALSFEQDDSRRRSEAAALLRARQGLERIEWRDERFALLQAQNTPFAPTLEAQMPRADLLTEAELACSAARIAGGPRFSRSYFVPYPRGMGAEVVDLCIPIVQGDGPAGALVASFSLLRLLEQLGREQLASGHELVLVEADGTRLARAGAGRGTGAALASAVFDLPGVQMQLRADSLRGRPGLVPHLSTGLVIGLSAALLAVAALLARDSRRRADAEQALAEALALRRAMEDSLPTGLRARDLRGRVTYANPAFCAMVGLSQEQLLWPPAAPPAATGAGSDTAVQAYWPPEFVPAYLQRQRQRHLGTDGDPREGHESVFMRASGERFPVMVYEAPLVNREGQHTGWMSAVVDLSAQRRIEELSRQSQERLQASARLATVGEMASLLSHELNQPLAAMASYAQGSLNLLDDDTALVSAEERAMFKQALQRIAEQAERAGRVIKSVHGFVRRREQQHEAVAPEALIEAVLPLVRLQARKSGTRVELDLHAPGAPKPPSVRCDRTLVEQVLLNLSRNGIQAMESSTPAAERVLRLATRPSDDGRRTVFSVEDRGSGIPPEVASRLFTPFFTTRSEGMGLGLSLCRTVAEAHGGALEFGPGPDGRGTVFRFSLPSLAPATATRTLPVPDPIQPAAESSDTAAP